MAVKKIDVEFIKAILKTPEIAIEKLDLIYVNRNQLPIERFKKNKVFEYVWKGKPLNKGEHLKRIESLVIPPAWEDVKISHMPNGHLQAIGKDLKQRTQYKYHPFWTKIRNQTKFYKMLPFGRQLPRIRNRVDKDLDQKGWSRSKVMALIIRLMEETHIRIGNEQYAKRNKTYGLSTLRTRHVKTMTDKLKFEFVGKKGKKHSVTLKNKKLIKLVNRCEELPGWELFQFIDTDGKKQSVDSGMINSYIHEICGELYTAKDFRTWAATIIFFESLMEMERPKVEKEIQKNLLTAYDSTAKKLGNTRNVCRKYYVHPLLVKKYEENGLVEEFKKVARMQQPQKYFSPSEIVVLELLRSFDPLIAS